VRQDFENKMKLTKTNLIIAGFLLANFVVLWSLAHHYTFHTGMDGRVIWRCNNFTGKVQSSSIGGRWVNISDPMTFTESDFTPKPDSKSDTGDAFDRFVKTYMATNKTTK